MAHKHSLDCLKLDKKHVWCMSNGATACGCKHAAAKEKKSAKATKLPKWKRATGKKCPHGLEIFAVDGTYVRNHFFSDFVQGGNGYRYRFCPKDELWIDWSTPKSEWKYVLFHECYETQRMREGRTYDSAHEGARRIEDRMRKRDRPGEARR